MPACVCHACPNAHAFAYVPFFTISKHFYFPFRLTLSVTHFLIIFYPKLWIKYN
nr:MAG TPA: hypothetical protein [Caudoviricetes sp.]